MSQVWWRSFRPGERVGYAPEGRTRPRPTYQALLLPSMRKEVQAGNKTGRRLGSPSEDPTQGPPFFIRKINSNSAISTETEKSARIAYPQASSPTRPSPPAA